MADPLSIALGAISIAQMCLKMTKILAATKQALTNVTKEADAVMEELSDLELVCKLVRHICEKAKGHYSSSALPMSDTILLKDLCGSLAKSVKGCERYMDKLDLLFVEVFGASDTVRNRRFMVKSVVKQFFKENQFQEIRTKISAHSSNIQGKIACLNSFYDSELMECTKQCLKTMNTMNASIGIIQASIQSFHSIIDQYLQPAQKSQFRPSLFSVHSIQLLVSGTIHHPEHISGILGVAATTPSYGSRRRIQESTLCGGRDNRDPPLGLAQTIRRVFMSPQSQTGDLAPRSEAGPSINKVFNVPQDQVRRFEARKQLLAELTSHLDPSPQVQLPLHYSIILSGMGGTGKTHLAFRVAHALRDLYFGVFWIDASSDQLARASWAAIATDLGLEPDPQLTYNHLLTLRRPWLAIIDNLDQLDEERMRVYIPSGICGRTLITTRLPLHKLEHTGIIAQKHYCLAGFSSEESVQFLMAEMGNTGPMSNADVESCTELAEALQHLPIALALSASYMRNRVTSPRDFLQLYHAKETRGNEASQNLITRIRLRHVFEIAATNLQPDALLILKLLSFFHYDDIPIEKIVSRSHRVQFDMMPNATDLADDGTTPPIPSQPYSPLLRRLYSAFMQLSSFPLIEQAYQTSARLMTLWPSVDSHQYETRFQAALESLRENEFVHRSQKKGMISLHRTTAEIVKTTFKSLAEEAVTCEIALNILASCIELDEKTFGNTVLHVDSRILLPHIASARQRSKDIDKAYQVKQQSMNLLRSMLPRFWWQSSRSTQLDPLRLMKFSIVYASSAEYPTARDMKKTVLSLLQQQWGTMLNHQCVHTSASLALTYHCLHRFDEAIEVQCQTIEASEVFYGKDHIFTLSMIDILGLFHLSRGDLNESLRHSRQARSGLAKVHKGDPQYKATLIALNHLGAVQAQHYQWKESRDSCEAALEGLEQVDLDGNEICLAKQNIAIAIIHLNDSNSFAKAEDMITDVWIHWRNRLGDNHPATIRAVFNRCRVLFRTGKIREAEHLLLPALAVAETRLGSKEPSFLSARVLLACIKLYQRDYAPAEEILADVNGSYTGLEYGVKYANSHMDRITALWYLMECYKEQHRFDNAIAMLKEMSKSLKISMDFNLRLKHPLAKNLDLKRQELDALKLAMRRLPETTANANPQTSTAVPQMGPLSVSV